MNNVDLVTKQPAKTTGTNNIKKLAAQATMKSVPSNKENKNGRK